MIKFSDLQAKIQSCISVTSAFNQASIAAQTAQGIEHPVAPASQQKNVARIINSHGRFYGLRSKYDGNGNKRHPMIAHA